MRIAGAVLLCVVLAGCASAPAEREAEPEPVASPTADAVVPDAPAQAFGGSCEAVLDLTALRGALGGAWEPESDPRALHTFEASIENVGGVACAWFTADRSIIVDLVPADAVDIAEANDCGQAPEVTAPLCDLDATANGLRMSGVYLAPDGSTETLREAAGAIEALFVTSASAATAGLAPEPDARAWQTPLDCGALRITGYTVETQDLGTDVYFSPVHRALNDGRVLPACGLTDGDAGFLFSALGGARWKESELRAVAGAEVVHIDGVELALRVPTDLGVTLNVFDGSNWLQVRNGLEDETLHPAVAAIVAFLNR